MSDPVKEQLSACLDGELPEAELDLLLKQLGRDPHLRLAMGAYARVGEVLRAERPVTASAGFAARVSAAIAAETQQIEAPAAPRVSSAVLRRFKPAIGVAIAAGVAALAVFLVEPGIAPSGQVAQIVVPESDVNAARTADQSSYTVPTNTASTPFVPAARLTNYVVAHSEYSSPLGRRTVLSGVLSEGEAQAESQEAAADSDVVPDAAGQPAADSLRP